MKKMHFYMLCLFILLIGTFIFLTKGNSKHLEEVLTSFFSNQDRDPSLQKEKNPSKPALVEGQEEAEDSHVQSHEEEIVKLSEDQIKHIGLEIQTAAPGQMILSLATRGKIILDPDRLAHIIPKISGMAMEARKNIGNSVRKGEVIAILESQEMADLKATYLAAVSKEELVASQLERENKLYQKRISSGQDFLNAQNSYAEAHIQLQLAIQKLKSFGLKEEDIQALVDQQNPDLRFYEIYSPMDGTVISRHITRGEFIDTSSTIYEIADLSTVWIEMGIYAKDLSRIREGQLVEVIHSDDNQTAQARLIYVSPLISDETITAKAIAVLDNPHGIWRPGSLVNVAITTDQISSPLVIPKNAIQKIEGADCAFVVTSKGFEKRVIQLGQCDHQNVEVLAGLNPGEQYAATQAFLLKAEMNKDAAAHDD